MFSLLNTDLTDAFLVGFLVGETNLSMLVGPRINKRSCLLCIKKRIESSVVYGKNVYIPTSEKTFKFALKKSNLEHLNNKIFEYNKKAGNLISTHNLISVPGCKNCR